ncbi:MAG: MBL fold metallo-hydrolase [Desulfovibrio sp.]|jgi:alkyl sulfatase BDS1-like metallo-beta-lactamase superfamily hydrolase|nr:MBL fold metallo-hydrolase [Desulfovibrio sp.]
MISVLSRARCIPVFVLAFLLFTAMPASGQAGGAEDAFGAKSPTQATLRANARYLNAPLNYADARDEERAGRGRIDAAAPPRVTRQDGSVVWDMSVYSFIKGNIAKPETFPDTVNPSLWRQALLNARHGLFEVAAQDFGNGDVRRIYQIRGYDVANMSFVETKNGFIVVDVTSYRESAAAAVALLYDNLPPEKKNKKIHTVIYTHSHLDHYGGIYGVLQSVMVDAPSKVTIVAPDGFMEAAVSENVTAGAAMSRRARIMYGLPLRLAPKDVPPERKQVNNGLAVGSGSGTSGMVPPTVLVRENKTLTFDGTPVEFLLAPRTEAPAEMAMYFPGFRSLCVAEICNQTQHNLLTPRGAEVRDPLAWSNALDEMQRKWVDAGLVDSAWGPHTWPRWGKDVAGYVGGQARLYRYIHDQTVFLMNNGYGMTEIAEIFTLPDSLAREWFNRGYYGDTRFNVKAVYQKYLGWFDGDPASLWRLPARASAALYAKYLPKSGGNLVKAAKMASADGHYRWVVEVLEHVRLAREAWFGNDAAAWDEALALQADAFEQLAYSAESGIWRNYFLAGAWRNRSKTVADLLKSANVASMGPDSVKNLSARQALESLSTQINGQCPEAAFTGTALWIIREAAGEKRFTMRMEDNVLWIREADPKAAVDATAELSRESLDRALLRVDGRISWLDALLEDPLIRLNDPTGLLRRIARLTHIAPPTYEP